MRYRRRLKERALALFAEFFGPFCQHCGNEDVDDLEFAHLEPTNIRGPSRGWERRYLDVLKNRWSYTLLCWDCHLAFDRKSPRERSA